jgi:transposase
MALGKRKPGGQELWIATTELPKSPGHPFYQKLNEMFAEAGFDRKAEELSAPYYADQVGRPGIPPGVYFRMLMVGYFEGIDSQRGIAWRCSDSLSLRAFLGVGATGKVPDHSSLTVIRQRLPMSVHEALFRLVLAIAEKQGLVKGKTVSVDATTLEANAAMKSIVRRDSGEDWKAYLTRLAQVSGIEDPTDEELRKFDKGRGGKKVSNDDWVSETDPESRITKMKDGRTHLGYKAEHAVDLDTDLLLAVGIHPAGAADSETMKETLVGAQVNLIEAGSDAEIQEAVADKGYHKAETLAWCDSYSVRTYMPEQQRKQNRKWTDKPEEWKRATEGNRRRTKGPRGKRLQKLRSEYLERSFAHSCETGGARRTWLRGLVEVGKRYVIHAAARNLGVIMRKLFGVGTPRSLQGSSAAVSCALYRLWVALKRLWEPVPEYSGGSSPSAPPFDNSTVQLAAA